MSPENSICSIDEAQLVSVAEEAEKTFSQQQQSSQICHEEVKEEGNQLDELNDDTSVPELKKIDELNDDTSVAELKKTDVLNDDTSVAELKKTDVLNDDTSLPELKKSEPNDILKRLRQDIRLKRKADSPLEDVKPSLTESKKDQTSHLEQNDDKPIILDTSFDSASISYSNMSKSQDHPNRNGLELDEKPKLFGQSKSTGKESEARLNNDNTSTSAEQILNDFTRRICNSIYRLNKSLLDLPPNNREIHQLFNSKNIEEHVNLLIKQSFHNPRLIDNTLHQTAGASKSMFRSANRFPNRLFGYTDIDLVNEDDLSGGYEHAATDEECDNSYSYVL